MKGTKADLIKYRMLRAWDTYDDARILAEKEKWNSAINRLYYSAYYAVIALLPNAGYKPTTHNGAKTNFTQHFIKFRKYPEGTGETIFPIIHMASKRRL